MRHTAASWMLAAGVDIASVARILGHTTPSTTLGIYAHAIPADAVPSRVSTIDLGWNPEDLIGTFSRNIDLDLVSDTVQSLAIRLARKNTRRDLEALKTALTLDGGMERSGES